MRETGIPGEDLVDTVRTRMLELQGKLDLQELRIELRRVTGTSYSRQTLLNFRSGSSASFRLAVGIAMTGMLPGVPVVEVPPWLRRRLFQKGHRGGRC